MDDIILTLSSSLAIDLLVEIGPSNRGLDNMRPALQTLRSKLREAMLAQKKKASDAPQQP